MSRYFYRFASIFDVFKTFEFLKLVYLRDIYMLFIQLVYVNLHRTTKQFSYNRAVFYKDSVKTSSI